MAKEQLELIILQTTVTKTGSYSHTHRTDHYELGFKKEEVERMLQAISLNTAGMKKHFAKQPFFTSHSSSFL